MIQYTTMSLNFGDIGLIAKLSAVAGTALVVWFVSRSAKIWNHKMVSRFYLSHFVVMIGYFLLFSLFSFLPLLLAIGLELVLGWFYSLTTGASTPSPFGNEGTYGFSTPLLLIGFFLSVWGAYSSYRDYLKQAA